MALVNTVMNVWVPYNAGKFLARLAAVREGLIAMSLVTHAERIVPYVGILW
jgi:hypothetical protein